MLSALFYQKNPFLTQISKRSTPTDLHHPDLHLAQFFSLESRKTFSAYAKTSLGLKMEKFLQTMGAQEEGSWASDRGWTSSLYDYAPESMWWLWIKAYSLILNRGRSQNCQNLNFDIFHSSFLRSTFSPKELQCRLKSFQYMRAISQKVSSTRLNWKR